MSQLFKAIVIDDEPAARRLLKSMLLEHSNVVEVIAEACNGKEAIAKVHQLKPDVIFWIYKCPT